MYFYIPTSFLRSEMEEPHWKQMSSPMDLMYIASQDAHMLWKQGWYITEHASILQIVQGVKRSSMISDFFGLVGLLVSLLFSSG